MPRTRSLAIRLALASLALVSAPAVAQQQLGAIQGTITDQTRSVLPGVTVTVTNLDTGITRTAVSNESGVYRVPSLDPSSTLQVVNQFIKHNKDFDLLVVPGMGHGSGGAYGDHKRFDFFTRHLLGVEPPEWKRVEDALKKRQPVTTTASGG